MRAVAEYKTRLAREFNSIQDNDCKSDGIQMHVKQQMLSVVTHLHVPLPVREKWVANVTYNVAVICHRIRVTVLASRSVM